VRTYQAALDALGDPTRRAIVERLFDGPKSVGELARHFPVSRPAISQHLRILKDASLVTDQAVGARRLYGLNPQGFDLLRDYLDRFWTQALTAFKTKVDELNNSNQGQKS
jgi:DNA-binding transcriptional ArsR family regulator